MKDYSDNRKVVCLHPFELAIFENGKKLRTAKSECLNSNSIVVENSKAFFANRQYELIEWHLQTFEEQVLMRDVKLFSGSPDKQLFAAVSHYGLLQTMTASRNLEADFSKSVLFNWRAILTIGRYAVVAGDSKYDCFEGGYFGSIQNYFFLVNLRNLSNLNKKSHLRINWIGDGSQSSNGS